MGRWGDATHPVIVRFIHKVCTRVCKESVGNVFLLCADGLIRAMIILRPLFRVPELTCVLRFL